VFGTSLSEIAVVGVVALVVVGPQKLPTMLRTLGQWTGKLRRMTIEMRAKTGIDEILREEGIDGVAELRSLLRGEIAAARQSLQRPVIDPYQDDAPVDLANEYPREGVDTMGAIPEDLVVHSRVAKAEAEAREAARAEAEAAAKAEAEAAAAPAAVAAVPTQSAPTTADSTEAQPESSASAKETPS
jgi:sec-independent protein translocase protein TatB